MIRVAIYFRRSIGHLSTEGDLCRDLRRAVEGRGGAVVATYIDDDGSTVRTRNAGWKALVANLDAIDQVVVGSARDLPGKGVRNLLHLLGTLRDHGVSLYLRQEGINTSNASASDLLDLIASYRSAKQSQAIRNGQARCGKRIGRPQVPMSVRQRIWAALANGAGVRITARQFNVSPASVINIRRSMIGAAGVETG
jgi:DNA invertase Pin-like site-specific DNA recombinase